MEKTKMETKRKQINKNELVARTEDEFYFCDYIFKDTLHRKPFCGATGTILRPISKKEYEERTSTEEIKDHFREVWGQLAQEGKTEESLKEFAENILNIEGDETIFDFSNMEYWDQIREKGYSEEEYPIIECIGGGRCFNKEDRYDEIYNKELLKEINIAETLKK